jgi:hypothetical protein
VTASSAARRTATAAKASASEPVAVISRAGKPDGMMDAAAGHRDHVHEGLLGWME